MDSSNRCLVSIDTNANAITASEEYEAKKNDGNAYANAVASNTNLKVKNLSITSDCFDKEDVVKASLNDEALKDQDDSHNEDNDSLEGDYWIDSENEDENEDSEDGSSSYDEEYFNFANDLDDSLDKAVSEEGKPQLIEHFYGFKTLSSLENAPESHNYKQCPSEPSNMVEFTRAYRKEVKLLQEGLPQGILVKAYEDRMDLFSALIMGPKGTPFEGGLFAFDIKLPNEYPQVPPLFHFISFTKKRLNPNLYPQGKVCVSLLGTWSGEEECERWSTDSTLLQVLISIQGLILVPEPFYNEAGFSKDYNTPSIRKRSKDYNEASVKLVLQAMTAKLQSPPSPWQLEITVILKEEIPKIASRINFWIRECDQLGWSSNPENWGKDREIEDSRAVKLNHGLMKSPDFPLIPFSDPRGVSRAIVELEEQHAKFCNI